MLMNHYSAKHISLLVYLEGKIAGTGLMVPGWLYIVWLGACHASDFARHSTLYIVSNPAARPPKPGWPSGWLSWLMWQHHEECVISSRGNRGSILIEPIHGPILQQPQQA